MLFLLHAIKPRTQKKIYAIQANCKKIDLNFIEGNYLGLSEEVLLFSLTANLMI